MTANVIDINQVDVSKIAKDEVFAIDTNVLIWTHYSKASNTRGNNTGCDGELAKNIMQN